MRAFAGIFFARSQCPGRYIHRMESSPKPRAFMARRTKRAVRVWLMRLTVRKRFPKGSTGGREQTMMFSCGAG